MHIVEHLDIFEITVDEGLTLVKLTGEPSLERNMRLLDYLKEHQIYKYRCIDFQDFKWLLSKAEVIRLSDYSKQLFTDRNAVCFVAENDLTYGILRESSVYRAQQDHAAVAVFRSRKEGLAWLKSQYQLAQHS